MRQNGCQRLPKSAFLNVNMNFKLNSAFCFSTFHFSIFSFQSFAFLCFIKFQKKNRAKLDLLKVFFFCAKLFKIQFSDLVWKNSSSIIQRNIFQDLVFRFSLVENFEFKNLTQHFQVLVFRVSLAEYFQKRFGNQFSKVQLVFHFRISLSFLIFVR